MVPRQGGGCENVGIHLDLTEQSGEGSWISKVSRVAKARDSTQLGERGSQSHTDAFAGFGVPQTCFQHPCEQAARRYRSLSRAAETHYQAAGKCGRGMQGTVRERRWRTWPRLNHPWLGPRPPRAIRRSDSNLPASFFLCVPAFRGVALLEQPLVSNVTYGSSFSLSQTHRTLSPSRLVVCLVFAARLHHFTPNKTKQNKAKGSMNFGQKGRELLQELRRSDWLPLYSEDAVSRCLLECQGHMAQIRPALAQEMVSECRVECEAAFVRAHLDVR